MRKSIILKGKQFEYFVRKSKRSKSLSISVESDTGFVVAMPYWCSMKRAESFIFENSDWIITKIETNRKKIRYIDIKDKTYNKYKSRAKLYIVNKVEFYSKKHGFKYNRISVKNLKSKWGSCSEIKNLNFNYTLYFLPEILADYIIIHELCHLYELNHSVRFWSLVEDIMPEYREYEKQLKKIAFK